MNTGPQILGIVNVTRDSFSDGGRYLDQDAAVDHARQLLRHGADLVDLGAESTHPDAEDVSARDEIERLTPVVQRLREDGARISIDTYKPEVMAAMLALGVDFINDVSGLRDPVSVDVLRDTEVPIIVMHSTARRARAERRGSDPTTIVDRVLRFFEERLRELEQAGIAPTRLVLDPGMGFFLGSDPAVSLAVLRHLGRLRTLGRPVCVSTSRKSFIGGLLGSATGPRPAHQRSAGTLATELWAAAQGADYIRTHEARALRDALTLWQAIGGMRE